MFAAYAQLDGPPRGSPALRSHFDQLPDTVDIQADEGIARENL